jgi:hypothetical protein
LFDFDRRSDSFPSEYSGGVVVVESSVILLFPLRIMGENYFTRKFQQQQQQANEPAGKCPDTHGE